jgi:hypothetical protein
MLEERLSRLLLDQNASARDGALRGLLSALWSFLQHPAAHLEEHLSGLEERLRLLEGRLLGDFKTAVDTGVDAVEGTVAGAEHRFEAEFQRAIHDRVAGIQARLEAVKKRVVDDLKQELRRVVLVLGLVVGGGVLALIGTIFGLMAAWTALERRIGALGASIVLAIAFLLASLVVLGLLRSVLHRSQPIGGAKIINT